MRRRIGC
jgi:hypothetical protein